MHHRLLGVVGLALLAFFAHPVSANICAFDAVPAATLLFPFVTIDYDGFPEGEATRATIVNTSPDPQILHVTFWIDTGVAFLDFNILLTGYDMITLDIEQVLMYGQLPVTLWEPHQTAEGAQDRGPISSVSSLYGGPAPAVDQPLPTDTLGDRCDTSNTAYPGLYTAPIPPAFLALFQSWITVSQIHPRSYSDDCTPPFSNPYSPTPPPWFQTRTTDSEAWFYITVDVNEHCHKLFPDSYGYFIDEARTDNVLTGDVVWMGPGRVIGAPAVHIEADVNLDEVATTHATGFPVSFYHRYAVFNDMVSDHREPLPNAWSMRYEGVGTDFIDTSIMVWKGSTSWTWPYDLELVGADKINPDELVATNCLAYTYYAWDEDENVVTAAVPAIEINEFPLATQRMDAENIQVPGSDGWVLFAWPPTNWTAGAAPAPDIWQTWMGSVVDYAGIGSIFRPAHPIANYGCFSDQIWPDYGIDYDYVDSGGYTVSPGSMSRTEHAPKD